MMSVISFSNIQCSEVNKFGSTASMSARLMLLFNNIYNVVPFDQFLQHSDDVLAYLVEGHGEPPINVVAVEHGNPHDASNKVEI